MYERTRVTAGKRFGMLPYSFSLAQLFYCWTSTTPLNTVLEQKIVGWLIVFFEYVSYVLSVTQFGRGEGMHGNLTSVCDHNVSKI